jgi:hypothetical protein
MSTGKELAALFCRDLQRLAQEVAAFPNDETLWKTLPGITNSTGNLTLHLEGNLREYIGRQLGGVAYQRERPREFADKGVPKAELKAKVEKLQELIPGILKALPKERWKTPAAEKIQGAELSVRQFVIHLHGHFNYHLGQIDYLRRALTGNGAIDLAGLA